MFAKQVKADVGDGWQLLVPRLQRALVAAKASQVCSGQVSETVSVAAMDELRRELGRACGVD